MTLTADIEATYENVYATCTRCGTRNVYNRCTDLKTLEPIANATVVCTTCDETFSIAGDLINTAHQMLLFDCRPLFDSKRYMQTVLGIAQAYEIFFDHFLHVQLVYRSFVADGRDDLDRMNRLEQRLYEKLERYTFEPMRRLVLRAAVDGLAPKTLDEAEATVDRIPEKTGKVPIVARPEIEAVARERLRSLLLGLSEATVNKLRNQVVHKRAYRPTRDETWQEYENASRVLFGLTNELRLEGDAEFYINGGDRNWLT